MAETVAGRSSSAYSLTCAAAVAASSLATEWLMGKTIDEAAELKNTDLADELELPPVKMHCSVLAEDAVKAALDDYRKKQAGQDAGEVKDPFGD